MTKNILFTAAFCCLLTTAVSAQDAGKDKAVFIGNKTVVTQRVSCNEPQSNTRFYEFFNDLKNEYEFDSERLRVAKLATEGQCFTSKQVKVTLTGFTYESTRIAFAEYAYNYVYDPNNYTEVKDGLLHTSSWDEVADYIKDK